MSHIPGQDELPPTTSVESATPKAKAKGKAKKAKASPKASTKAKGNASKAKGSPKPKSKGKGKARAKAKGGDGPKPKRARTAKKAGERPDTTGKKRRRSRGSPATKSGLQMSLLSPPVPVIVCGSCHMSSIAGVPVSRCRRILVPVQTRNIGNPTAQGEMLRIGGLTYLKPGGELSGLLIDFGL